MIAVLTLITGRLKPKVGIPLIRSANLRNEETLED